MAKSSANRRLTPPAPSRQLAFHQLLVAARKTWLVDALSESLREIDQATLKRELLEYAPVDALQILAGARVRDEYVFPTPVVLKGKPTLIGYYRLLLGASQKACYTGATGMTIFKSMETDGSLRPQQESLLPEFCKSMCLVLADLIRQISPAVTPRDIDELRLLTLGSQFQGANNVKIGQQATADVFLAVSELFERYIVERSHQQLIIKNASRRRVHIVLSIDPDIKILEEFGTELRKKVAIEIKGGHGQEQCSQSGRGS